MNKNYFLKVIIFLFLSVRVFSQTASQLTVTPNSVATLLAQTITGSGVTVSSASLNCGGLGYVGSGTFSYPLTGTDLGLTNGILLTTGQASDAASFAQIINIATGNNFSDPDLTAIETLADNDNCILQFDFVPVCNQISIKYVFGSSEYDGWQCSTYNDAFGMFLTGPNPSGGNYTATNIATLPSGTPVSISNINNGSAPCTFASNPSYYVDNSFGTDVVYEGMTIPITSVKPVIPCSLYHMKIAIADAGDEVYDSGVFIQGNSVSCTTAPAASIASTSVSCGGSNGTAAITVTNYTATPTYSWSPGSQTTSSISGLSAGTYTCLVGFATACAGVYTQTLTTTIANPTSFALTPTSLPASCSGSATGSATIAISGGTAPYTIAWGTTPTQTTTTVANLTPGTYTIGVHDNAGCSQATTVNVGIINPTTLTFTTTSVCGNNALLTASFGTSYQWYDTLNNIIPGATAQTYTATNVLNGQHYIVSYKDNITGCKDSLEVNISKYNLNFTPIPGAACHGGNGGNISLSPSGTYTFSSYNWSITGVSSAAGTSTTTPIYITNLAAGNYTVAVSPVGNASCLYTFPVSVSSLSLTIQTPDTLKACNFDTLKLNPPIAAGDSNHWYTSISPITHLGNSAANVPYLVLPPQVNNSTFIDTIVDPLGCKSLLKINIKIQSFQLPKPNILHTLKCYNDSNGAVKVVVPRETNGPIGKPYTFTWIYPAPYTSPAPVIKGSTPPQFSQEPNLHAGTYTCVVNVGNCVETATITIVNPPKPPTDSIHAYYCPKDSLGLLVADTGYTNYVWHPSNGGASVTGDSIRVPVANINSYYVTYTSGGCPDTAKILIPISTYNAFVPNEMVNVFSPNGDNRNEVFYPFYQKNVSQYEIARQSKIYELKIYNRWGILVYETTDYTKPWDGKNKNGHDADADTLFLLCEI